ncbi:MAG: histidinol dehydrogenase, partial [Acidobacteria bacterium]
APYMARDLISQAEHGADSIVGVVTTSRRVARDVVSLLSTMVEQVERSEVVRAALIDHGFVLVCDSIERAVQFANAFAPEHLEIMARRARALARRITSAGLILIGDHSPVPASDYVVGTNHVLPTGGAARVYSGLSVLDFLRRVHIVECTPAGLRRLVTPLEVLARAEGLPNHARAVKERFT